MARFSLLKRVLIANRASQASLQANLRSLEHMAGLNDTSSANIVRARGQIADAEHMAAVQETLQKEKELAGVHYFNILSCYYYKN